MRMEICEYEHCRQNHADNDAGVMKWFLVIALIVFLIPCIMMWHDSAQERANENQGKIKVGSYKDLIGEDYKSVKAHMEAAGFTNIRMVHLDDSWWNDGEVTMISIGGDAKFGSSDYFDPCTPVVISYH